MLYEFRYVEGKKEKKFRGEARRSRQEDKKKKGRPGEGSCLPPDDLVPQLDQLSEDSVARILVIMSQAGAYISPLLALKIAFVRILLHHVIFIFSNKASKI